MTGPCFWARMVSTIEKYVVEQSIKKNILSHLIKIVSFLEV